MKLHEIPTPALIVDLPAMQRNIDRMAAYFAGRTSKLRPHFKAHKTPAIAKRQLAAGNCTGLTCATVGEAEVVVRERLCDEILIANEIVGPGKAARAAKLAGEANLIVAVDSDYGLDDIAAAARAAGTTVGVLVDVGVGLPRCGIAPGEPAVALAKRVDATDGVVLRGVMGYEGHVVAIEDRAEREAKAAKAMERLLSTARMVREAGLRCDIVSAGGTGTYDITGGMEGITEVQAGSYVLMDTAYAKLDIPFEMAFTIRGTVLSRPRPEQCADRHRPQGLRRRPRQPDREGRRRRATALPQRRARHDRPARRQPDRHRRHDRPLAVAHRPHDQPARRAVRGRRRRGGRGVADCGAVVSGASGLVLR